MAVSISVDDKDLNAQFQIQFMQMARHAFEKMAGQTSPKWLTRKEAAQYVGISPATLDKWSGLGCKPHVQSGVVRYNRDEIDNFLMNR